MGILFLSFGVNAADKPTTEFFSSNNTEEISLQTAYARLTGKQQQELQDVIIDVMQKNHIEQGKFEDSLGVYQMAVDNHVTADNTEIYRVSPYQVLSNKRVFSLAQQLALNLKQESVAVFIPEQNKKISDIKVTLASHPYTITETLAILHEKLPPLYSQAFSLHVAHNHTNFNNDQVTEIEWLGQREQWDEIKYAFPQEKIVSQLGSAYLIFKNGHVVEL